MFDRKYAWIWVILLSNVFSFAAGTLIIIIALAIIFVF